MGRSASLDDDEIIEIQRHWRKTKGYRGFVTDAANRYGVSKPTILAALRKTIDLSDPFDQGVQEAEKGCACTEATIGLFSTCGHPVTCRCSLCKYHSRGLRVLVGVDSLHMREMSADRFVR